MKSQWKIRGTQKLKQRAYQYGTVRSENRYSCFGTIGISVWMEKIVRREYTTEVENALHFVWTIF